jgi:hypothetical protein
MSRSATLWISRLKLLCVLIGSVAGLNRVSAEDHRLVPQAESAPAWSDPTLAEPVVQDGTACSAACGPMINCAQATACDYTCPLWMTEYSWYQPPVSCEHIDPRFYRSIFLGHLWVEAEYLAWACSDTRLPPLTVANPAGEIDTAARFLVDPLDVHGRLRSGGRLTAGYWFTPEQRVGIEAGYFGVDGHNVEIDSSDSGSETVSRYLVDAMTNARYAVGVVEPGRLSGSTRIESDTSLSGAEVSWRQILREDCGHRLDYIAGYRYLRLWDGLQVLDHMVPVVNGVPSDSVAIARLDRFETESEFHGAQFGLISRWWYWRWAVQTVGKIALGGTRSGATVRGGIVRGDADEAPEDWAAAPVGVLAGPWNSGDYGQSEFSAVAEAGIRLEYALTQQFRLQFGYTFLYLSSVTRVLDSVTAVGDPDWIPDPNDPDAIRDSSTAAFPRREFAFENSNFWTQGLSVGFHYDF